MKRLTFLLFLLISLCFQAQAQERIDGNFAFQTDPAKQYSIYVPSAYDASMPHKMMLGFHPLNTDRWNSISWCDTLIAFAEANDLLLVCPDGGSDGAVDDPIDVAFTTVLLDSMLAWYNVDEDKVWAMGFSWGGRTTYSYGLSHPDRFQGFMPIGAAINGTTQVNGLLNKAAGKTFYIIHGSNDSPATRFTPIVNALNDSQTCLETNLLSGVNHTIDFPNRNQILTDAFQWLEQTSCAITNIAEATTEQIPSLYPNPIQRGEMLQLKNWKNAQLFSAAGKIERQNIDAALSTSDLLPGVYFIVGEYDGKKVTQKIVVR